ncbi:hypothetical protein HMSSN139_25020 [Paenibacillus sp. HMSSN-139]|nr:hypothetical protein HMSSN139_25020 [Paenibacillus sp. HMSSN-139]
MVALSLTTGTASAKATQENGKGAEKKVEAGVQADAQQTKAQEKAANGKKVEQASEGTVEEQATEETQTRRAKSPRIRKNPPNRATTAIKVC